MSGGNSGADCEVIRGDGVGEFLFILGEHLTVDDGGNFSFKIQCAENGEVCAGEVRTCSPLRCALHDVVLLIFIRIQRFRSSELETN